MADNAGELVGIDIDRRDVSQGQKLPHQVPKIRELRYYDGRVIPFNDDTFDVVTCIDVIEHVPDYQGLMTEMIRVSSQVVLISTPNRRPEYSRPDGKPKNLWHLREWSYKEFNAILKGIPGVNVEWNVLDGPWIGPFQEGPDVSEDTMALVPALLCVSSKTL